MKSQLKRPLIVLLVKGTLYHGTGCPDTCASLQKPCVHNIPQSEHAPWWRSLMFRGPSPFSTKAFQLDETIQQSAITMDMDAEAKVFDSSLLSSRMSANDNFTTENEATLVEAGRVLFTNAIITVDLLPWIVVGVVGFAGFAFFLWLMGYDLVRKITKSFALSKCELM